MTDQNQKKPTIVTPDMLKQIELARRPYVLTYSNYSRSSTGLGRQMAAIMPTLRRHFNVIEFAIGASNYHAMHEFQGGNVVIPTINEHGVYYNNEMWGDKVLDAFLGGTEKEGPQISVAFINHDPQALAHIGPILKKYRIPIVYWCLHDNDYITKKELIWISVADRILFQTEYARKIVRTRTKIFDGPVIYPALDQSQFPEVDPHVVLKRFKRFLDEFKGKQIIFVNAKNQARKNLAVMLRAMKMVHSVNPDAILFLHMPPNVETDGTNSVLHPETLDIDDYLDFIGMPKGVVIVSDELMPISEINAFYRLSTVVVNPSCSEGFGMCYLEAFQTGKPIIATDYSATSEILADGRGILVPPAITEISPFYRCEWAYVSDRELASTIINVLQQIKIDLKSFDEDIKRAKDWLVKYNSSAQGEKISDELKAVIENREAYQNPVPIQTLL